MTDTFDTFQPVNRPTPAEPLRGLTVLVVEDSRFASEALRLMCLHSGARVRRADCLRSAERHLSTYRPSVTIVDLVLPDGSGLDLIGRLDGRVPRLPVILATSGDPGMESAARDAGAQGFLAKPLDDLYTFQRTVIGALPGHARPGRFEVKATAIAPDPATLREDLAIAGRTLRTATPGPEADYVAQFLAGLGRSTADRDLEEAAASLRGLPLGQAAERLEKLRGLVVARLRAGQVGARL
ncbi:MAG: response regulator [Rhodobacteraceae bacterium]|nr:response regulator [Paracoccaceae bacterium]MCB2137820.1 response regulator [Paracoccaceae bacterium]